MQGEIERLKRRGQTIESAYAEGQWTVEALLIVSQLVGLGWSGLRLVRVVGSGVRKVVQNARTPAASKVVQEPAVAPEMSKPNQPSNPTNTPKPAGADPGTSRTVRKEQGAQIKTAESMNAEQIKNKQDPSWKEKTLVYEKDLPEGYKFNMVVDELQLKRIEKGEHWRFGNWGTIDNIPTESVARSTLSLPPRFKQGTLYMIEVKVKKPIRVNSGTAGKVDDLPGEGHQFQILSDKSNLEMVGQGRLLK